MNNFDFNNCTGKNVRIVILDSGILKDIHCINYNGKILDDNYKKEHEESKHAKLCLLSSKIAAPNAEYILINVAEESSETIIEDYVISGLNIAMSLLPKIIITSFSFETISEKLEVLFKKATDSGIIICASVDPIVRNSYPQRMDNIISVDESKGNETKDDIILYNGVFYISPLLYSTIGEYGSSIANAYFAGVIACIVEFSPLVTFESIKSFYKNSQDSYMAHNCSNAYYLFSGQHEVDNLAKVITPNYLYYYDDKLKEFKSIKNNSTVDYSEINEVDIICGDDFMIKRPIAIDEFKKNNISYNCFDNFSADLTYLEEDSLALKTISIPSICICSYGMNMEKFKLQLYLNRYLELHNYDVGNVSFNPIAHLLGYSYLQYPYNVSYPQYIYFLNTCLYNAIFEKDILISSVAGEFDRFINFEHRLGDLSGLFFSAHNPDVVILSLSDFIQITELKKVKHFIENSIGAKLIFYISKHSKDDNYYGPSDYNLILDNSHIENYCKKVADATKIRTFSSSDLTDDSMFKYFMKLFG